jgi:hypothetical protein
VASKLPVELTALLFFLSAVVGFRAWYAFFRDVIRIMIRPIFIGGLSLAVMLLAWSYRPPRSAFWFH